MKAIDELAKFLHDRYEHHAKENEWDTQTSCKTEFKDLPDANKKTMIAVASDLTALIEDACREQREACAELCMYPVDLPVFKCDEIKARIMNTPLITNKPESDE